MQRFRERIIVTANCKCVLLILGDKVRFYYFRCFGVEPTRRGICSLYCALYPFTVPLITIIYK